MGQLARPVAESMAAEWLTLLSLVFGGCCTNVWTLESILNQPGSSPTFLTAVQFLCVTLYGLPSQLQWTPLPRLKPRRVPLYRWAIQVFLFFAVSLANNYAFELDIPVTLHIIFRSGGLCVSMIVGYLFGNKRYSARQIIAGLIISSGILAATLAKPGSKGGLAIEDHTRFIMGIGLLTLSLVLSGLLGLVQESTFRRYGKCWEESMFYTHFLSLPLFAPFLPAITSLVRTHHLPPLSNWLEGRQAFPPATLALLLNLVTQTMCIQGVNRMTARVSSTTVNLVLTCRKTVSLVLSAWYYGHGFSAGLALGSAAVAAGTLLYAMPAQKKEVSRSRAERQVTPERTQVDLVDQKSTLDTPGPIRRRLAQAGSRRQVD